jgi:hypothetical protein
MHFINFGFNFVVMLPSVLKKASLLATIIITVSVNYCFKYNYNEQDWLSWANRCLSQSYDSAGDAKLKKVEIFITPDFFIRLRKTYAKNRQEYYSFNLRRLNDMNYLGDAYNGTLQLKTIADDVIVQTYNNRKGDVDSMATMLSIPVKNMEPERLDSLREALNYFKGKGL